MPSYLWYTRCTQGESRTFASRGRWRGFHARQQAGAACPRFRTDSTNRSAPRWRNPAPSGVARSKAGLHQAGAVLAGTAPIAPIGILPPGARQPSCKAAARISVRAHASTQRARFGRVLCGCQRRKRVTGRIARPNGVHGRRICGRKAAQKKARRCPEAVFRAWQASFCGDIPHYIFYDVTLGTCVKPALLSGLLYAILIQEYFGCFRPLVPG